MAVTLLVVLWGCATIVDLLGHTSSTVRRTFPSVSRIALDLGRGGSVTIVAEDRSDVALVRRINQGLHTIKVSEKVAGDTLALYSKCPPRVISALCNASYDLRVPLRTSVVGSNDGGSIRLTNVIGVDVRSAGGRITLDGVSGAVSAHTDGGGIDGGRLSASSISASSNGGNIKLTFAVNPDEVEAATDGGSVLVEVPDDASPYRVDATSNGGRADVGIASDPRADRSIRAHSDGGNVAVHYSG